MAHRRRTRLSLWIASVLVGACTAALVVAQQPGPGRWDTVGGDAGNTRFSPLSQINAETVTRLGAA